MKVRKKRMPIPKELGTADIIGQNHQGRGIAKINGKTVFISNALLNEKVTFKYRALFGQYDDAEAVDIQQASPERIPPQCPHYLICGGCSLQHWDLAKQRAFKEKTLLTLIEKSVQHSIPLQLPALLGNPFGYRRKARLSVKYVANKNEVLVGFRERFSPYVAVMQQCDVLHPSIGKYLSSLKALLLQLHAKADIPQIEVATGDDKTVFIIRHLQPLSTHDLNLLSHYGQDNHLQILLQSKGLNSIRSLYPENAETALHYQLTDYHLSFAFEAWQFIQVNAEINRQMIAEALNLLDLKPEDEVLDLFCGIGNFTLPIAKFVKKVVGVEGEAASITKAQYNAANNHITNAEFYCFDLQKDPKNETWSQQTYHKLLLDPARSGAKEILPYLKIWQPEKIVYVSCNPSTLARDCALICELGYTLNAAGIMDMFPQTEHTEAMVVFHRQS